MAETDTGSQTPSPLGNDPGECGGEHGLRGGTRADGTHPEDPGVDRNTRHLETARGILSYAELAPLLAEKVTMAEAAIAAGVYDDNKIDEFLVKDLHLKVCGEFVPGWAGRWRDIEVKVGKHQPPPPHKIPIQIRDFVLDLDARWDDASQSVSDLTLEFLAFAEGRFLTIHPFRDFNGRTVRLLLSECLRRLDLPLVALTPEGHAARQEYFLALEAADSSDWSPLCEIWKQRLGG
jgi:CRISPR-associated endonuclease/helicase Cas3